MPQHPLDDLASPSADAAEREETGPFQTGMLALFKVSLAGFGGALAGLSVSRRRGTFGAASAAAASVAKKRRKGPSDRLPYVDQELPGTWAAACMAFAGIVEMSRLVSPTGFAIDLARTMTTTGGNGGGPSEVVVDREAAARTVGDYALGGAAAGAAFRGMAVRTTTAARLAAAGRAPAGMTAARGGILAGAVPGAALGFLAGGAQLVIDRVAAKLEREERERVRGKVRPDLEEAGVEEQDDYERIRTEVDGMTTEDIRKKIDEMKGDPAES